MICRNLPLVLGIALLAGCDADEMAGTGDPSSDERIIYAEGSAVSDGLSISSGNVIIQSNQPGIAFATVTTPEQPKSLAYFLVFNHDLANKAGVKTGCGSNGTTANTFHTLNCFGNQCTVAYKIVLENDAHDVAIEELTIGKSFDPDNGRVFLIDMKVAPPELTQLKLQLPADVPSLKATHETQKFGQATLTALRKADPTVDDFCQQATPDRT